MVKFNAHAPSVQKERRMQRMAYAMNLGAFDDEHLAAQTIANAIEALNQRLGLASGLAPLGVEEAWFDKIIEGAMADHCHKTNPRLASAEEYRQMLLDSM